MEECTTPNQEPCDIYGDYYKYFNDQPSETTGTQPESSASSSSSAKPPLQSMLVTGFGLRRWESLQRALLDDEERRQMLLAQYARDEEYLECGITSTSSVKSSSEKSETKTPAYDDFDIASDKLSALAYLLGVDEPEEEWEEKPREKLKEKLASIEGEEEEEGPGMTLAMRKARKYLRQHKIFEFFQFLIAHLLSEAPENPIQFIIDLLDRCLLYRSGFGRPPLLYEKPHLEQLFYLMDRMRTGFIEMEQYETGMKTLGICSYDKHPPLSTDGWIAKDVFIEEAYECLTDLFVDMIRRRGGQVTPPSLATPPPTAIPPSLASQ